MTSRTAAHEADSSRDVRIGAVDRYVVTRPLCANGPLRVCEVASATSQRRFLLLETTAEAVGRSVDSSSTLTFMSDAEKALVVSPCDMGVHGETPFLVYDLEGGVSLGSGLHYSWDPLRLELLSRIVAALRAARDADLHIVHCTWETLVTCPPRTVRWMSPVRSRASRAVATAPAVSAAESVGAVSVQATLVVAQPGTARDREPSAADASEPVPVAPPDARPAPVSLGSGDACSVPSAPVSSDVAAGCEPGASTGEGLEREEEGTLSAQGTSSPTREVADPSASAPAAPSSADVSLGVPGAPSETSLSDCGDGASAPVSVPVPAHASAPDRESAPAPEGASRITAPVLAADLLARMEGESRTLAGVPRGVLPQESGDGSAAEASRVDTLDLDRYGLDALRQIVANLARVNFMRLSSSLDLRPVKAPHGSEPAVWSPQLYTSAEVRKLLDDLTCGRFNSLDAAQEAIDAFGATRIVRKRTGWGTHRGCVRDSNEDALLILEETIVSAGHPLRLSCLRWPTEWGGTTLGRWPARSRSSRWRSRCWPG